MLGLNHYGCNHANVYYYYDGDIFINNIHNILIKNSNYDIHKEEVSNIEKEMLKYKNEHKEKCYAFKIYSIKRGLIIYSIDIYIIIFKEYNKTIRNNYFVNKKWNSKTKESK